MDRSEAVRILNSSETFSTNELTCLENKQVKSILDLACTILDAEKSFAFSIQRKKICLLASTNLNDASLDLTLPKNIDKDFDLNKSISITSNKKGYKIIILPIYSQTEKIIGIIGLEKEVGFELTLNHENNLVTISQQISNILNLNILTEKVKLQSDTLTACEKNYKESETILNYTNEITPLGIIQCNLIGEITYSNSKFRTIAGYYNSSPKKAMWFDNIIIEEKETIQNTWNNAVAKKESFEIKSRYLHQNGTICIVKINASPIVKYNGEIKYLFFITDITQKFREEEKLKKAKENAQFAIQQKEAFLANMSHEIRTPMNAIVGFTDVLQETIIDDKQKEYINLIKTAGQNLLSIINDILDFSKIDSTKVVLNNKDFTIADIKTNVYELLKHKANDKKIEFNFIKDESLPEELHGDFVHINQVLINLANNAIKFTEKGSVTLSLTKLTETKEDCEILFKVTDTGIGISKDSQELIFERYFQAENTINKNYGGTGLGLNISKILVEEMGGAIQLESEAGKGSEFSFKLRIKKSFKNKNSAVLKSNYSFQRLPKIKILAFEDNSLNVQLLKHLITEFGFEIEIAENGILGIEKLQSKKYDLIIMDLDMPIMDGYLSTKIIRNELKLITPIIAMTAHTIVGEKEKCFSIGMNDFIAKPINKDELFEKICNLTSHNFIIPSSNITQSILPKSEKLSLSYLKSLSNGSEEFEREMIEVFLKIVPDKILELKKSVDDLNIKSIKSIVHSLKGSIAIIGIPSVSDLLLKIEDNINNEVDSTILLDPILELENALPPYYLLLKNELNLKYKNNLVA